MAAEKSEDPGEAPLLHSLADGVLTITLNRPNAANAITPEMRNDIIGLLNDAGQNAEVRAVLFNSIGKHFCAGADIGRIKGEVLPGGAVTMAREGVQRLISAFLDCPRPIVGAVQGTAAGLGAHVAYACDLVLVSEQASFIESFAARGMTLDAGGAHLLTRRIGLHRAKEMVFFADKMTAQEADRIGLVNRVVPADELEAQSRAMVERLAQGPTVALGFSKMQLNRAMELDRNTAFFQEGMSMDIACSAADFREGLTAFGEKRPTKFTGR